MKMKLNLEELQVESFETVAGEPERGTVRGYITGTLGCNCTEDTCASCEGTCDTCFNTCPDTCANTCPATCRNTCPATCNTCDGQASCVDTCWESCDFTECAWDCTFYPCTRMYCM
ncbi:MAG TPA: pinensin family lanthipeptide [Longimicrobium sp.]